MNEIKIPFGRSQNGMPVSVDAVARGKACDCVCWECGGPLVARKGEINQHHFAHYVETACVHARETSIHSFAKHVIAKTLEFRLPDDLNLGPIHETKVEEWLDGIRPDVLVWFRDELVAVEIRVAHPVPPEKIQKLAMRKLATLEIDLGAWKNAHKSEEEWTDIILRNARRFWLFEPRIVRFEIECKAREEAQRYEENLRQISFRHQFAEARRRQDEEFEARFAAEAARRVRERENLLQKQQEAETEYHIYQKDLRANEPDPMIEGLKICADTKFHFEKWERHQGRRKE